MRPYIILIAYWPHAHTVSSHQELMVCILCQLTHTKNIDSSAPGWRGRGYWISEGWHTQSLSHRKLETCSILWPWALGEVNTHCLNGVDCVCMCVRPRAWFYKLLVRCRNHQITSRSVNLGSELSTKSLLVRWKKVMTSMFLRFFSRDICDIITTWAELLRPVHETRTTPAFFDISRY